MSKIQSKLHEAKANKKDEFYTRLTDIENELKHYKHNFKGKTVLLPCDDIELLDDLWFDLNNDGIIQPEEKMSMFWFYFHKNFNELGLKKLIATSYHNDKQMYKVVYEGGDGKSNGSDNDVMEFDKTELQGNGDFRSPEVIELMKEADIIVTNPPFSLFREFVDQLERLNKKYLIVGHQNAITYKEIFKLMKENKMWLGYGFKGGAGFFKTRNYKDKATATSKMDGHIRVSGVHWFTNIEHSKRNDELHLVAKYSPDEYPKYDNYNAINVDKTKDIPKDYDGVMGVPITFMDKYNPEQFELVKFRKGDDEKDLTYNGKTPYFRILIRKREQ